jgi:hypothetical protein
MSDDTQGTAGTLAEGTTADQVADKGTEQQVEQSEQKPEGEQQAEQAGEQPEGEQERKRLSGAQKAKRRETFLLNQLAERERELQEIRQASRRTEGEQSDADKPPKEEDFNGDWTAYVAARAAYEAGKAVEGKLSARETRDQEVRRSAAERERDLAHLERVEEAREIIADYDTVMAGMKGVTVSNDVIREIKSSEKGALIAYELARNPDRLAEMSRMTPIELAREMGRLEAAVKVPAAKKQTTAPPPPTTLRGGAAPSFDPAKADMNEFADWLQKDLAKRRGR